MLLIGAIEMGMDADMIAVDENPLDDLGALTSVSWVMRAGRAVERADVEDCGAKHSV